MLTEKDVRILPAVEVPGYGIPPSAYLFKNERFGIIELHNNDNPKDIKIHLYLFGTKEEVESTGSTHEHLGNVIVQHLPNAKPLSQP